MSKTQEHYVDLARAVAAGPDRNLVSATLMASPENVNRYYQGAALKLIIQFDSNTDRAATAGVSL